MSNDAISLSEIFQAFQMPIPSNAFLEWSSGLIRINLDFEQWELLRKKLPTTLTSKLSNAELKFLEVYDHETYHFAQFSTCGYLYRFACTIWNELTRVLPKDFSSLEDISSSVLPESLDPVRRVILDLDQRGPEEITTRMIIESDAYLFQKRCRYADLNASAYLGMLHDECPSVVYRYAFDYYINKLGQRGFPWYHLVANLALCSESPPAMFFLITGSLFTYRLLYGRNFVADDLVQLALQISDHYYIKMLGSSPEVHKAFNLGHPVYSSMISAINRACYREERNEDGFSILKYFTNPEKYISTLASDMVRPMIFNRRDGGLWYIYHPHLDKPEKRDEVEFQLQQLLLIGAISWRVMSKLQDEGV